MGDFMAWPVWFARSHTNQGWSVQLNRPGF